MIAMGANGAWVGDRPRLDQSRPFGGVIMLGIIFGLLTSVISLGLGLGSSVLSLGIGSVLSDKTVKYDMQELAH